MFRALLSVYRARFCIDFYPHDRKGGGLVVWFLNFKEETLFRCPIQIDYYHGTFMD